MPPATSTMAPPNESSSGRSQPRAWLVALILACGCLATYSNSLTVPFTFDDVPSIVDNPAVRNVATAWKPVPGGSTVSGRPLLNLSFALNFRISGLAVWSYHGANLLVHVLSALTLFGFTRRALASDAVPARLTVDHTWIAGAIALLWALHPLQTESVTYIVQRAESLGGLLVLLTLYCFARGIHASSARWHTMAVCAAWAGAATKEISATAPLLALLYDRCFVAGTFAGAWRARHRWYVALGSAWLVTGWLVWSGEGRGDTAGFGGPARWWEYAALQLPAIAHYLRVAVWPGALAFDFGPFQRVDFRAVLIAAALVVPAIVATAWALVRRPALGFVGALFFVALAPSSSIVPIPTQIAAEHRMYLPLASVVALLVLAGWTFSTRFARAGVLLLSAVCALVTWHRNAVFADPVRLWTTAVAACPNNPRAHVNLGEALVQQQQLDAARAHFEAALRLQPNYVTALYDLGTVLLELRQPAAAIAPLAHALEREPRLAETAYNLGTAYAALDQPAPAARWFQRTIELDPTRAKAHYNLANSLIELQQVPEAIAQYRQTVALEPGHANAHFNLGNALFQSGRPDDAIVHYETVLRLNPNDRDAAEMLTQARRQSHRVR